MVNGSFASQSMVTKVLPIHLLKCVNMTLVTEPKLNTRYYLPVFEDQTNKLFFLKWLVKDTIETKPGGRTVPFGYVWIGRIGYHLDFAKITVFLDLFQNCPSVHIVHMDIRDHRMYGIVKDEFQGIYGFAEDIYVRKSLK